MVARRAHNPEVVGSNPSPATICENGSRADVGRRAKMRIDLAIKLLCGALALHTASTQTTIWRRSLVGYSGRFIPGRSLVRIRSPLPLWSNPLGSLAQLVRAPALQAGGHRFESCSFHQLIQIEYTALWSSGLRHRPFTAVTRVRTSVGSPKKRHSNECLFLLPTEVAHFQCARATHGELGNPTDRKRRETQAQSICGHRA